MEGDDVVYVVVEGLWGKRRKVASAREPDNGPLLAMLVWFRTILEGSFTLGLTVVNFRKSSMNEKRKSRLSFGSSFATKIMDS